MSGLSGAGHRICRKNGVFKEVWHTDIERSDIAIRSQDVVFGLFSQFSALNFVFGIKIAQQSISCGDNCTPQ